MNTSQARRGTSILEVLTTMLVATVGVFGVVALIPFAARQSELGLSQEDGINAARNLQQRLEATGYYNPFLWSDGTNTALPNSAYATNPLTGGTRGIRGFCLDPIGFATGTGDPTVVDLAFFPNSNIDLTANSFTNGTTAQFPRLLLNAAGTEWVEGLPRFTVFDLNNVELDSSSAGNLIKAKRLFGYDNDLVYQNPLQKADAPTQDYLVNSANTNFKRATNGSISTMVFAIARGDDLSQSNEYTFYTVVFNRRVNDPTVSSDRIFLVNTAALPPVIYGGGDIAYTELTAFNPDTRRFGRNDWVMLLNANPSADPTIDPDQIQSLQFYRVQEAYEVSGSERLTLQGGDFKLTDSAGNYLPTYMIYMPDVIAVYESTFRWEGNSTWN